MSRINGKLCCLLLLIVSGCGPSGPTTATITGEVKRTNGDPLSEVSVAFFPEAGPSVVTKTDASGAFTAVVAVGKSKVAVIEAGEASSADSSPAAAAAPKKPRIPPRFNSAESSGLVADVGSGEKVVFVID